VDGRGMTQAAVRSHAQSNGEAEREREVGTDLERQMWTLGGSWFWSDTRVNGLPTMPKRRGLRRFTRGPLFPKSSPLKRFRIFIYTYCDNIPPQFLSWDAFFF
jgi:hypothetical protein